MSKNIGEELVSVYLRLKGFFLLPNFVIHKTPVDAQVIDNQGTDQGIRYAQGEADILAIRLKKMKEVFYDGIVEVPIRYGSKVFDKLILSRRKDLYLWVEVTMAERATSTYISNKFSNEKCNYVLNRMGLDGWIENKERDIYNKPYFKDDDKVFAKILVTKDSAGTIVGTKYFEYDIQNIRTSLIEWFQDYKKKGYWHLWDNVILQALALDILSNKETRNR